jgi:hypothetical protein
MASQEAHPPVVTVTSEPIPAELGDRPAGRVDLRLGSVPDLSQDDDTSGSELPPPPVQVVERERSGPQPSAQTAVPVPASAPFPVPPSTSGPIAVPPSMSGPVRIAPSTSGPSIQQLWQPDPASALELEPAHRRSRLMLVIGIAATVSIALGIVVLKSGGNHRSSRDAESDPAMTHVIAPSMPGVPSALSPEPVAVTAADAAVVVAPVNVVAADSGGSGIGSGSGSGIASAMPDTHPTQRPHPAPLPSPADELPKQFGAGHYADVVALCASTPSLASQNAVVCVAAACHVHDASHARKWLKAVGSKHASVVQACAELGTALEADKPERPDCSADPLSCQH